MQGNCSDVGQTPGLPLEYGHSWEDIPLGFPAGLADANQTAQFKM